VAVARDGGGCVVGGRQREREEVAQEVGGQGGGGELLDGPREFAGCEGAVKGAWACVRLCDKMKTSSSRQGCVYME